METTQETQKFIAKISVKMREWQWKDSGLEKTFAQNWERASESERGTFETAEQYVLHVIAQKVAKNVASLEKFAAQVNEREIDVENFTNSTPWRCKLFNFMTGSAIKPTTKAMKVAAEDWNNSK